MIESITCYNTHLNGMHHPRTPPSSDSCGHIHVLVLRVLSVVATSYSTKCFVDPICCLGVSCVWQRLEQLNILKLPFALTVTEVN